MTGIYYGSQMKDSKVTSADLSAKQYHFVSWPDSNQEVGVPSANALAFGVLQNKPGDDEHASVAIGGLTKLKVTGTVAEGDPLTTDAAGVGKVAASGNVVRAYAVTANASGDGFITAMLSSPFILA